MSLMSIPTSTMSGRVAGVGVSVGNDAWKISFLIPILAFSVSSHDVTGVGGNVGSDP